ncbi:MAG TPA: helix-turn-helix domain-containing protein [Candidatus Hydrogenedentes bacterium]|nr:helix-turn-helix domain-containing protein [Candidatus Hydrogenedentota bacterium]
METTAYKTMSEVSATLPGRPHVSAVWRWCRKGIKSRNGERVRLEHTRIGGKIYVKESDLDTFLQTLTDADLRYFNTPKHQPGPSLRTRTTAQRQKAIAQANARLAKAGI